MRPAFAALLILSAPGAFAEDLSLFKRKPDVGVFGGIQKWSLWKSDFKNNPGSELITGGVLGGRAGWDFTRRWGGEVAYTYGVNNLRLLRPGLTSFDFGARNHQLSLNPLFHLTGPESKLRPYVTAGLGAMWFDPAKKAQDQAAQPALAVLGTRQLDTKFAPAFNWGGGVKYNLNKLLQLRLDARNVITQNPHFMLPAAPAVPGGVFIAPKGAASGMQLTGGVGLRLGGDYAGGGDPKKAGKPFKLTLAADSLKVPVGQARVITASTDLPQGVVPAFQWTRDGQATDVTAPSFPFTATSPGAHQVCALAAVKGYASTSECVQIEATAAAPAQAAAPAVTVTSSTGQLLGGGEANLKAAANPPGANIRWTVNGQPVLGAGPDYVFRGEGRSPGDYRVCAVASIPNAPDGTECTTVTIRDCGKPSITAPSSTAEVFSGDRAPLNFTTKPNECGSPVQLSYQTGEGSVMTTPNGAVFDSSGVAFDMTDRSRLQRKTVAVTATARDQQGNTATAQSNVVVKLAPAAQRLDDIVFAQGSSRVNNCAKRLLLEVLAPKLQQDPNAKVVLIGHVHDSEKSARVMVRGRNGRSVARPVQLDRSRVLNAAAVLSAGKGVCASIDGSRIKVSFAGTSKGSDPRPSFCGSSTQPRATGISAKDPRMPDRRVEVWIVPDGAAMPNAGAVVGDMPAEQVKALGCPR